jgi:hypothetical protein
MSLKESGHWYDAKGNPCHTQVCGPKAKNPTRPTTIRDARKLGLFPSVTSILGILAKPQLERWKFQQITNWCYNAEIKEGFAHETDQDGYFTAAIEGAFQQVQDAADAGSRIHAILEDVSNGKSYDKQEFLLLPEFGEVRAELVIEPVVAFFEKHVKSVVGVERCLVNKQVGFAGMADLLIELNNGKLACIDFKTRKTQPGKPCEPYDGQPMQIAAYAKTAFPWAHELSGCNLYISTTEPGRIADKWYDNSQIETEFKAFCHVAEVWKHVKGYDPTAGGDV